jgi:Zn-dependent M28 family amino/carboxypeptidase
VYHRKSNPALARAAAAVLIIIVGGSCGANLPSPPDAGGDLAPALRSITSGDLDRHIDKLASDDLEGRAPGTTGEQLTVRYLIDELTRIGLAAGNKDGTYVQHVSLVGATTTPSFRIASRNGSRALRFPDDYVAWTRHGVPAVTVQQSDIVFVGYGVVAPEYGWDDYKGVDVRGKTILMLVNDPAVPLATNPATLDPNVFKGPAMTYYGRWTYKYEIAAQKGAAAAIIVHETGPAGYPYEVVSGSWGGENFDIKGVDGRTHYVPVEGWIHQDRATDVLKTSGFDFDQLKRAAIRRDFKPVFLGAKATFTLANAIREVRSQNVLARLEGADPGLRDEYVIYTAHWDHLGRNASLQGDQIFNGAVDNATGVAALLELAEAYKLARPAPRRSILFLATTAEEHGLLGAKHYAQNPIYPLEKTAAVINMDALNQWGRTRDVVVIGLGNSTLDDVLKDVAAAQKRIIAPDPETEKGYFYRSDHFEFAKEGVPSLYVHRGNEYLDKPADFGRRKRDEYTSRDYHKVSDERKPDWDLSGAVEDVQMLFEVGYRVAQQDRRPEWKAGTEFKAKRDAMLASSPEEGSQR